MNRRDILKATGLALIGSTLIPFNSLLKANIIDHCESSFEKEIEFN